MNLSDLTVLARELDSSDPDDQDAQKIFLDRSCALRTQLRRDNASELATCLGAVSQLLEVLAGSRPSIGRGDVKSIACRLLQVLGSDLGDFSPSQDEAPPAPARGKEPVAADARSAATVPAPRPPAARAPVAPAAALPSAALPAVKSPSPPRGPSLQQSRKADMAFGRMLIELGHVTRGQVAAALRFHRSKGPRIGECLLLQGVISPDRLLSALKIQELLRTTPQGITPETLDRYKKTEEGEGAEIEANGAAPGSGSRGKIRQIMEGIFLGEVLLGAEMITNEQLEKALHLHHHKKIRVGEALVQLGALTEDDVEAGLELQERLRRIAGANAV